MPHRCHCAPSYKCSACLAWEAEEAAAGELADADDLPLWSMKSPHPVGTRMRVMDAQKSRLRLSDEEVFRRMAAWFATYRHLPVVQDWRRLPEGERPAVSLQRIYRGWQRLDAFYEACVEQGILTAEQVRWRQVVRSQQNVVAGRMSAARHNPPPEVG